MLCNKPRWLIFTAWRHWPHEPRLCVCSKKHTSSHALLHLFTVKLTEIVVSLVRKGGCSASCLRDTVWPLSFHLACTLPLPGYLGVSITSYLCAWSRVFCSMRLKVSHFLFSLSRRNEWKIWVSNTWGQQQRQACSKAHQSVLCVCVCVSACVNVGAPSCKTTGLLAPWSSWTPHC